jgi:hypothetical protein
MIDLVPLSEFSDRHNKGWRMVAGFPLAPGDYAVTMQSPGHRDLSQTNIQRASAIGKEAMRTSKIARDRNRVARKLEAAR